jgi:tetratricopeptide (TPR) repeat protein
LATVLKALGDYTGAKELLQKAMISAEKNFGKEHPTTAVRYSNLATVLQDLGDFEQALELSDKSVKIFNKTLPKGHPNIEIVKNIYNSIKQQIQ